MPPSHKASIQNMQQSTEVPIPTDPQLAAGLQAMLSVFPNGLDLQDLAATRAMLAAMHAKRPAAKPAKFGVTLHDFDMAGVPLRLYRPVAAAAPSAKVPSALPVLIWLHGGGFLLGQLAWDDRRCMQLARDVGCAVLAVDYRLAPEHPFPAALQDAYQALHFVQQQAGALALDACRVAIGGASAGAGLAAAVALWARDQGNPELCLQLLLYPMLDDRTVTGLVSPATATAGWSLAENRIAWRYYLGYTDAEHPAAVSPYAAPARATNLQGLPPTWIGVGSADLFAEESKAFAMRLQQAEVPTTLCWYPQAFHGFDSWAAQSSAAKDCWQQQVQALQQAFNARLPA
ncbi:MAG TPA: hypothetical protein DCS87_01075 [Rheinheimera sp.]|nr:hypothetical protein [Rheinheimera sp.]